MATLSQEKQFIDISTCRIRRITVLYLVAQRGQRRNRAIIVYRNPINNLYPTRAPDSAPARPPWCWGRARYQRTENRVGR
jgi:hypothetical protein